MIDNLILFDGVCNLCNSSVNFIVKNDTKHLYKFASLQSEIGQNILLANNKNPSEFESVILLEKGVLFEKSDAVLQISKNLAGWSWAYFLRFIPKTIRDFFYQLIAKNRYSVFGRSKSCRLPSPEERELFLG